MRERDTQREREREREVFIVSRKESFTKMSRETEKVPNQISGITLNTIQLQNKSKIDIKSKYC